MILRPFMTRLCALLTSLCFLFSFILSPAVSAAVELAADARDLSDLGHLLIPSSLGRITDARWYGGERVVINIQNLHCHPESQRKISQILELLDSRYGLDRVFVEGAIAEVDTSWLTGIADNEQRRNIAEALVSRGSLTGAELYSITSGRPALLEGMEDREPYMTNIIRLNRILELRPAIQDLVGTLKSELEPLKTRYLGRLNRRLERAVLQAGKGRMTAKKYYSILIKSAQRAGVNVYGYRNLSLFLEAERQRMLVDDRRTTRELQRLMVNLKVVLPYREYADLQTHCADSTPFSLFTAQLRETLRRHRFDIGAEYPHLAGYLRFTAIQQTLNPYHLLQEERRLVNELRTHLSASPAEQEVAFLSDFAVRLEAFLNTRATPADYTHIVSELPRFRELLRKYLGWDLGSDFESHVLLLTSFYDTNLHRNERFVDNVLGKSQGTATDGLRLEPNTGHRAAVLGSLTGGKEPVVTVTGGFHTEGLTDILRRRRISYIVITPHITESAEASQRFYDDSVRDLSNVFTQTLELYLLSERLNGAGETMRAKGLEPLLQSFINTGAHPVSGVGRTLATLLGRREKPSAVETEALLERVATEWNAGFAATLGALRFEPGSLEPDGYRFKFIFDRHGTPLPFLFDGETIRYLGVSEAALLTAFEAAPRETADGGKGGSDGTLMLPSTRDLARRILGHRAPGLLVSTLAFIISPFYEAFRIFRPVKYIDDHAPATPLERERLEGGVTFMWVSAAGFASAMGLALYISRDLSFSMGIPLIPAAFFSGEILAHYTYNFGAIVHGILSAVVRRVSTIDPEQYPLLIAGDKTGLGADPKQNQTAAAFFIAQLYDSLKLFKSRIIIEKYRFSAMLEPQRLWYSLWEMLDLLAGKLRNAPVAPKNIVDVIQALEQNAEKPELAGQLLSSLSTEAAILRYVREETVLDDPQDALTILQGKLISLRSGLGVHKGIPLSKWVRLYDVFFSAKQTDVGSILLLSGGTGSNHLVRSLVNAKSDITLLVNAYDDGKSTGYIRRAFGILGPSDIAKNIVVTMDPGSPGFNEITNLLDYRLPKGDRELASAVFLEAMENNVSAEGNDLKRLLSVVPESIRAKSIRLMALFYKRVLVWERKHGRPYDLSDHGIRNILFAGAYFMSGEEYGKTIDYLCDLFHSCARIVLNNNLPLTLIGLTERGDLLNSEAAIVDDHLDQELAGVFLADKPLSDREITDFHSLRDLEEKRLFLRERDVEISATGESLAAIERARIIVFAPTTLPSSLLPTLKTVGISARIRASTVPKVLIANIKRERGRHKVSGLLAQVNAHLQKEGNGYMLDYVLVNSHGNVSRIGDRYTYIPVDIRELNSYTREVICRDLEDSIKHGIHNGNKSAGLIEQLSAMHQIGFARLDGRLVPVNEFKCVDWRRQRLLSLTKDPLSYQMHRKEILDLALSLTGSTSIGNQKLRPMRVIIPAAGKGSRLKSGKEGKPKPLFEFNGMPMLGHMLKKAIHFDAHPIVLVREEDREEFSNYARSIGIQPEFLVAAHGRGPGFSILSISDRIAHDHDLSALDLMIMWVDVPNLRVDTLKELVLVHQGLGNSALTLSTAWESNPYAGIVRDDVGNVIGAFVTKTSPEKKRAAGEHDASAFVGNAKAVMNALREFDARIVRGEITIPEFSVLEPIPVMVQQGGLVVGLANADPREAAGINTLQDAEHAAQVGAMIGVKAPVVESADDATDEQLTAKDEQETEVERFNRFIRRGYHGLAIDVDDTITDENGNIPETVIDHLVRILEDGIPIAVITGRTQESLQRKLLDRLNTLSSRTKAALYVYPNNGAYGYLLSDSENRFVERTINGYVADFALRLMSPFIDPFDTYAINNYKMTIWLGNEERSARSLVGEINKLFNQYIVPLTARSSSKDRIIIVSPTESSKKTALEDFAGRIGSSTDNIARLGDRGEIGGIDFDLLDGDGGFSVQELDMRYSGGVNAARVLGKTGLGAALDILSSIAWVYHRTPDSEVTVKHHEYPVSASDYSDDTQLQLINDLLNAKASSSNDVEADIMVLCGNECVESYERVVDHYIDGKIKKIIISGKTGSCTKDVVNNIVEAKYEVAVADGMCISTVEEARKLTVEQIRHPEARIIYDVMKAYAKDRRDYELPDAIVYDPGKHTEEGDIYLEVNSLNTLENFKNSSCLFGPIRRQLRKTEEAMTVAYTHIPIKMLRTLSTFNKVYDNDVKSGMIKGEALFPGGVTEQEDPVKLLKELWRILLYTAKGDLVPSFGSGEDSTGIGAIPDNYWKAFLSEIMGYHDPAFLCSELRGLTKVTTDNVTREILFKTADDLLRRLGVEQESPIGQIVERVFDSSEQHSKSGLLSRRVISPGMLYAALEKTDPKKGIATQDLVDFSVQISGSGKAAPAHGVLSGKNLLILSPQSTLGFERDVRAFAEEGMRVVTVSPLPRVYPANLAVNLSEHRGLGYAELHETGGNSLLRVFAEKVSTPSGMIVHLYYEHAGGYRMEDRELWSARCTLAVARWLRSNHLAQEELRFVPGSFKVDILETEDVRAHPGLLHDDTFPDDVTLIYAGRPMRSLPPQVNLNAEFATMEGQNGGVLWEQLSDRVFDSVIAPGTSLKEHVSALSNAFLVKTAGRCAVPGPVVYEHLDIGEFPGTAGDIAGYLRERLPLGIDTFVLSATDIPERRQTFAEVLSASRGTDSAPRYIFEFEPLSLQALPDVLEEAEELIKNGATGIRLDLSMVNDCKDPDDLASRLLAFKAHLERINPEALLPVIEPLTLDAPSQALDMVLQVPGIKRVVRYLPGRKPVGLSEGCWLEMCLHDYKLDAEGRYSREEYSFEAMDESSLKDAFKCLLEAREASAVGFSAGILEGAKSGMIPLKGEMRFDIAEYFLSLARARIRDLSLDPDQRYERARLTALRLSSSGLPSLDPVRNELLDALRFHRDVLSGQAINDSAIEHNAVIESVHAAFNRLYGYRDGKEGWETVRHYLERQYRLASDAEKALDRERANASAAGFTRGLLEAAVARSRAEKGLTFARKDYNALYPWLAVEAELGLEADSDGRVLTPSLWDERTFIRLGITLLELGRHEDLRRVLDSYAGIIMGLDPVSMTLDDDILWFTVFAGAYARTLDSEGRKALLTGETAGVLENIAHFLAEYTAKGTIPDQGSGVLVYNAMRALLEGLEWYAEHQDLSIVRGGIGTYRDVARGEIAGELPQDTLRIASWMAAFVDLNQDLPAAAVQAKVEEAANLLRGRMMHSKSSTGPLASAGLLHVLGLYDDRDFMLDLERLGGNVAGTLPEVVKHILSAS